MPAQPDSAKNITAIAPKRFNDSLSPLVDAQLQRAAGIRLAQEPEQHVDRRFANKLRMRLGPGDERLEGSSARRLTSPSGNDNLDAPGTRTT
jgi:hypothetical protein